MQFKLIIIIVQFQLYKKIFHGTEKTNDNSVHNYYRNFSIPNQKTIIVQIQRYTNSILVG